jgi:hypothetical protein
MFPPSKRTDDDGVSVAVPSALTCDHPLGCITITVDGPRCSMCFLEARLETSRARAFYWEHRALNAERENIRLQQQIERMERST